MSNKFIPIREKNSNRTIALFFIAIICFIYFVPHKSFAGPWNGWFFQNQYPTSNTLLGVKFVTPNKGWIVGDKGTILYTTDGGENWEEQASGTGNALTSIAFIDEKTGWTAGNGGSILHTTDGGKTWKPQGNTKEGLHKIFFLNEKEGWVVGNSGTVLRTTDGGNKWEKQDIGTDRNIACVYFIDTQSGWVLAGDEVFITRDGGIKWETSKLPIENQGSGTVDGSRIIAGMSDQLSYEWWQGDIYFVNSKKGFVVVGLWQILQTEDGGKTWVNQSSHGYMSYGLGHISFSDAQKGCVAGSSIFCTEDSGKTWKEQLGIQPGNRGDINGIMVSIWGLSFVNQSTAWAVGNEGQIIKTEDGGKSWKQLSRKLLASPYFFNGKTGWRFERDVLRTDDGGDTWKAQSIKERMGVDDVFFLNDSIAWAVGDIGEGKVKGGSYSKIWGKIIHTSDGWKTWTLQFNEQIGQNGRSDRLSSVYFANSDVGWVVGSKGLILHTKDGGKHWIRQASNTNFDLESIQFVGSEKGWIVGDNGATVYNGDGKGIILYTEDSGRHWRIQLKKNDVWLRHIFFVDNKIGWVTGIASQGHAGIFLYTKDGGKHWMDTGRKEYVEKFFFHDKKRGWIEAREEFFGEFLEEKYYLTGDGGKTWKQIKIGLHKHPWRPFEPEAANSK